METEYELGHSCAPAAAYPAAEIVMGKQINLEEVPAWMRSEYAEGSSATARESRAARMAEFSAELTKHAERYEDIRTRGAEALSAYDVHLAGSADAALRMALSLKYNHIIYALMCIEGGKLIDGSQPQMTLF